MKPYPIEADWLEEHGWEAEAELLRGVGVGPAGTEAIEALERMGLVDASRELHARATEHAIQQLQIAGNWSRPTVLELIREAAAEMSIPASTLTAGLCSFASAGHDAMMAAGEAERTFREALAHRTT